MAFWTPIFPFGLNWKSLLRHHGMISVETFSLKIETIRIIQFLNIQKVFRFVHFWVSFPIKTTENIFGKISSYTCIHAFKHSNFASRHYFWYRFRIESPRLWLFTLSWDKVWKNQKTPIIVSLFQSSWFSHIFCQIIGFF